MGILQPEPSSQRARVRAAESHPAAVGQPSGLTHHRTEVSQISQGLAAAEEAQAVRAEVPEGRRKRIERDQTETGSYMCHFYTLKFEDFALILSYFKLLKNKSFL